MKLCMILIIIFIICSITLGIIFKSHKSLNSKSIVYAKEAIIDKTVSSISVDEISQGWYWWANKSTKKEGTPDDWIFELEGTRGAKWTAPKE